MPYAILVIALIALDQLVKFLVRTYIPLQGAVPFLPHIVQLTYVRNTGAAFSLFEGHTWVLALVSALVAAGVAFLLWKPVFRHPFGRVSLALVLAGAVGNLIDRVFIGYVTDMFQVLFMNFAVFNVADMCVVCGGIAFCVYFAFFHDRLERKESAEHGGNDAPDADR